MCAHEGTASLLFELEAGRRKSETPFSLLANKISSKPPLLTPTVITPLVLANLAHFSFLCMYLQIDDYSC